MRILLDTHILEWLIADPAQLNEGERGVIDDPAHSLVVSPVSIWEIRVKWQKWNRNGDRKGLIAPAVALSFVEMAELELVPLTVNDCATLLSHPIAHGDPFDQLLLVHAQQLDAKVMTRDRLILGHPLTLQL